MTTTPRATATAAVNEALLRQMATEIREEIPEAEVRLFGSHARGDARPSSDVDLMIIVTDEWYARHNWFETLGLLWRKLAHHRVPIDLLLYPRSKVEERRHWLSHVIALAHREGRVLDAPACAARA
jgi:predicted nucleotidyltransferase